VRAHGLGLLIVGSVTLGLAELLDQGKSLALESTLEPARFKETSGLVQGY
jgi:hypothetical protein